MILVLFVSGVVAGEVGVGTGSIAFHFLLLCYYLIGLLYLNLLGLRYYFLLLLFLIGLYRMLVPLINVRLDVPVRTVVPDGLDHRFDFAVQFLTVLAPEVSLCCVYDEFHVLAACLQNRVLWENTQILFL